MNIFTALRVVSVFLTKKNSDFWEDRLTQDGIGNTRDEKKHFIVLESKQAFKEEQGHIKRTKVYILTKGI